MGQCLACSEEAVPKEKYDEIVQEISSFLHGGYKEIKKIYKKKC